MTSPDDDAPRSHHCHARDCKTPTRPEMLMCRSHWARVPDKLQKPVYATYRHGQCDDMKPSKAWHEAADAAIGFVALMSNLPVRNCEVKALVTHNYHRIVVAQYVKRRTAASKIEATIDYILETGDVLEKLREVLDG